MFDVLGENAAYFATFVAAMLVSLFCWSRGGRPERIAGLAYGACWLLGTAVSLASVEASGRFAQPLSLAIASNAAVAAVFLYLTLRHNSPWLCAAVVAQGAQLGLNVVRRSEAAPGGALIPGALLSVMFVLELVMMASLVGATLSAMASRRAPAPPQAA